MLRPGERLHSATTDVQVVVVRAPSTEVTVACGGAPMLREGEEAGAERADSDQGEAPIVGKRYADEDIGIELLCTRGGAGSLTADGVPLLPKGAKPLPSSD